MKLFASKFTQTLLFNVATISAIVVGIVQFAVRAYKENNGDQKVRQFVIQTLKVINTLTSNVYNNLNHDLVTVPVQQQSTKRAKRA
jgi:hypothetical protein